MKFANATNLNRKSGGKAHFESFFESIDLEKQSEKYAVIFGPRTLRRTWGTRPVPTGFC